MSTTYFITPISPKEWEAGNWKTWEEINSSLIIQPEYLASQLQTRWANNEIYLSTDTTIVVLIWYVPSYGKLHNDLNSIAFKPCQEFAEFVLWYRSIIDEEYKLFLSNDSSNKELELTPQTTLQEVEIWYRKN